MLRGLRPAPMSCLLGAPPSKVRRFPGAEPSTLPTPPWLSGGCWTAAPRGCLRPGLVAWGSRLCNSQAGPVRPGRGPWWGRWPRTAEKRGKEKAFQGRSRGKQGAGGLRRPPGPWTSGTSTLRSTFTSASYITQVGPVPGRAATPWLYPLARHSQGEGVGQGTKPQRNLGSSRVGRPPGKQWRSGPEVKSQLTGSGLSDRKWARVFSAGA